MKPGRILLVVVAVLVTAQLAVILGTRTGADWITVASRDPVRIELTRGRTTMGGPDPGDVLRPSAVITGLDSDLSARLGDLLHLHLEPNTAAELPPPPARWFGGTRTLSLAGGEAWIRGAPELDGRVEVAAGAVRFRVDGAEIVLRREGDAVEIQLLAGRLEVRRPDGAVSRLEGEVGLRLAPGAEPETRPVDARTRALAARARARSWTERVR